LKRGQFRTGLSPSLPPDPDVRCRLLKLSESKELYEEEIEKPRKTLLQVLKDLKVKIRIEDLIEISARIAVFSVPIPAPHDALATLLHNLLITGSPSQILACRHFPGPGKIAHWSNVGRSSLA
jgi:hypothetical protein